MSEAGYSGTPLVRKLGLKAGQRVLLHEAPPAWVEWVAPLPPGIDLVRRAGAQVDLVHAFFTRRAALADALARWRRTLPAEVVLWVSWPKKAARVDTDITEDVIRELALPLGWVDVKVCAVDATWSGLKLVVRRELRGGPEPLPSGGRGRPG